MECRRGPLQEGAHTQSETQQYVQQSLGLFLFQAPFVPFVLVSFFIWSLFSIELVFVDRFSVIPEHHLPVDAMR